VPNCCGDLAAPRHERLPQIYADAMARNAARPVVPAAYARLVPERKDDLAWENDKVAFRVYGPALRAGAEDSGIDAWTKRVPYPVLNSWYRRDRMEKISYHQDHGEGLDAYHVGNTRGCGGLGLWIDGKLVTADTYIGYKIHWTTPDVAEFTTIFEYPIPFEGKPVIRTPRHEAAVGRASQRNRGVLLQQQVARRATAGGFQSGDRHRVGDARG
jgi:hypothetical protein